GSPGDSHHKSRIAGSHAVADWGFQVKAAGSGLGYLPSSPGICSVLFLFDRFLSALRRTTAPPATYFISVLSSYMYSATVGSAAGSPRCASPSIAAALTSQLLSPAALIKAFSEPGSGSRARVLAAAARKGETSSLVSILNAS